MRVPCARRKSCTLVVSLSVFARKRGRATQFAILRGILRTSAATPVCGRLHAHRPWRNSQRVYDQPHFNIMKDNGWLNDYESLWVIYTHLKQTRHKALATHTEQTKGELRQHTQSQFRPHSTWATVVPSNSTTLHNTNSHYYCYYHYCYIYI